MLAKFGMTTHEETHHLGGEVRGLGNDCADIGAVQSSLGLPHGPVDTHGELLNWVGGHVGTDLFQPVAEPCERRLEQLLGTVARHRTLANDKIGVEHSPRVAHGRELLWLGEDGTDGGGDLVQVEEAGQQLADLAAELNDRARHFGRQAAQTVGCHLVKIHGHHAESGMGVGGNRGKNRVHKREDNVLERVSTDIQTHTHII